MNNLDMSIARLYTPTSLHLDPICKGIDRGRVAQLEEHRPYKPGVTGSSPVPPTIYIIILTVSAVWILRVCGERIMVCTCTLEMGPLQRVVTSLISL